MTERYVPFVGSAAKPKKKVVHLCAKCGRKLKPQRWIYSSFTGNRYCWPGEGCSK